MQDLKTVRRCTVGIKACPRAWDRLAPTDREDVRHCAECHRDVHFCATDADTIARARAGLCVARLEPHPDSLPEPYVVVGRPDVSELPPEPTAEELAILARSAREHGIAECLLRIESDTLDCAHCGYPVPTFRKTCYVCRKPWRQPPGSRS